MKIAIIGGGITGLTAAYELTKKGCQITVFEKEKYLGGLAAGFKEKNWSWQVEHFYHHLFTSDKTAQNLIDELGLKDQLFYNQPKTSIFKNNRINQFDSLPSLLQFPHLSLSEKIRAGLVTAYLRTLPVCFEQTTAENWLKKYYGNKIYQILWQPLLKAKFGSLTNQVSMVWFWARIKKRSSKLGYLEGGFQVLVDALAEKIKKNGGKIIIGQSIKKLTELKAFDKIIITIPTPEFLKIGPRLPRVYRKKLSRLKFVGALSLILVLKKKFLTDNTYWLNINESGFPFVAVVEHTNFIEKKHYNNAHLLYVGGYYPQNHHFFKMNKNEILKEFLPYLQIINPKLDAIRYTLYANKYAQPVIPVNYSKLVPSMKTPVKNLYLANQSLIYPWDRGINYAIELGQKVAVEVI